MKSSLLRSKLLSTSALVGVALSLAAVNTASAADIVITGAETTTQTLADTDTLTVESTGSVITAGTSINVDGVDVGAIDNQGTITSTAGDALVFTNAATVTGGIDNSGDINSINIGININTNSSITGDFINSGTINATVNGIFIDDSVIGGLIDNSGDIMGTTVAGIRITDVDTDTAGITNSGTIIGGAAGGGIVYSAGTNVGDITNSGTITVAGEGIILLSAADSTGDIINSGDITSTLADGITLNLSTLTGNIHNTSTGTITSATNAIDMASSTVTGNITNDGTLMATENGFEIEISTIGGNLVNNGDVTADENGIEIDDVDITGSLINNGNIDVTSGAGNGISIEDSLGGSNAIGGDLINTGDITSNVFGIATDDLTLTGEIFNSGNISASSPYILGNTTVNGGIRNTGTLDGTVASYTIANSMVTGDINNSGTINGFDIQTNTTVNGDIINSGTINSMKFGINVTSNSTLNGDIINSGTNLSGISMSDADFAGDITNTGTISNEIGNGIYVVGVGEINLEDGSVTSGNDAGGFSAVRFDDLTKTAILNLNGGRVIGNIDDQEANNFFSQLNINEDFTTEGNIAVSNIDLVAGKTLTISKDTEITGYDIDFTTGTLNFGIASTTSRGNIQSFAAPLDFTGTTVTIEVQGNGLADGDEIFIASNPGGSGSITGTTGAAGQAETAVTDNSFLWDFTIADGSQAEVTGSAANSQLFAIATQTNDLSDNSNPENTRVATTIENITPGTDDDLDDLLDNLATAPTKEALNDVLASASPAINGALANTSMGLASTSFDITATQLNNARNGESSGTSSGGLPEGFRAWTQAFGQTASQNRRDSVAGYDADTAGITFGIDTANIADDMVVGAAFSYAYSDIDSNNSNSTATSINSYQLSLYGDYDIDNSTYVSGMVGYAFGQNESDRFNVGGIGGPTATSEFDSHVASAQVEVGRDYKLGEVGNAKITPKLLANYTYYNSDNYTETGAGGLNLTVENEDLHKLDIGLGAAVEWESIQNNGSVLRPQINIGYRYDVIGDNIDISANFAGGGATFKSRGIDPARHTINTGAAIEYHTIDNWKFTAGYDYEYKDDFDAHSGTLRASLKF